MIRKARITDVVEIQKMLRDFAAEGLLLARPLSELYTTLRDLVVFEDEEGTVAGCCGLHIIWSDLAEIRSLAVARSCRRRGIGRRLVEACMSEAVCLGISKIFTLTYEVEFFERLGFRLVDKNMFPQKVWADCVHCPKFPNCDESALLLDIA
ncbi:MAG: N-acetyltransferase [Syntrophobacteraceae bacterium]|nr:N-acetyltransferase [Syntrophobacteraceae bacterium]